MKNYDNILNEPNVLKIFYNLFSYTEDEIRVKVNLYRTKVMGQGKEELAKDEFGRVR